MQVARSVPLAYSARRFSVEIRKETVLETFASIIPQLKQWMATEFRGVTRETLHNT